MDPLPVITDEMNMCDDDEPAASCGEKDSKDVPAEVGGTDGPTTTAPEEEEAEAEEASKGAPKDGTAQDFASAVEEQVKLRRKQCRLERRNKRKRRLAAERAALGVASPAFHGAAEAMLSRAAQPSKTSEGQPAPRGVPQRAGTLSLVGMKHPGMGVLQGNAMPSSTVGEVDATVAVRRFPRLASVENIYVLFAPFGAITSVRHRPNAILVKFHYRLDALSAVRLMNKFFWEGRPLDVEIIKEPASVDVLLL